MLGAATFAISGNGLPTLFANTNIERENLVISRKLLTKRLMAFLLGGLRAPLSKDLSKHEFYALERQNEN